MNAQRIMKWAAITLCIGLCAYVSWIAVPFFGFKYASSKMDWVISSGVTRHEIEENKGLLSSKEIDQAFFSDSSFFQEEYLTDANNKIVTYSLFAAFFTVVYDGSGHTLFVINNGMHGRSPM
ncbi:MAG: hypothetical protein ABJ034_15830 [Hyphomicrobiales bacterium]